jgi:3,4-dihydroxy 2-butanone 4-phosphate synthase/GTP cyclohydrolase II
MTTTKEKLREFEKQNIAILIDDLGDQRGVFVSAAEVLTDEQLNIVLANTGGIPLVAISNTRAKGFMLAPMSRNTNETTPALPSVYRQYTSVEARVGVTTGISVADRVKTIQALGARTPHWRALVQPGHIFPVFTHSGGCLAQAGIPEAALDLVTSGAFADAALFVEILCPNGEHMQSPQIECLAEQQHLPIFTISELVQHRLAHESLIERTSTSSLPTEHGGTMLAIHYRSKLDNAEHLALVKGNADFEGTTSVRVQVEDPITDLFGGGKINSRRQIKEALARIANHGRGVFIYLRKGTIDLHPRSEASSVMRNYGLGAQILRDLGVSQINLLSATRRSLSGLDNFGICVVSHEELTSSETEKGVQS